MKTSSLYRAFVLASALVVGSLPSALAQTNEINANAVRSGFPDTPFLIDNHTASIVGSVTAFVSGAHGSATATTSFGAITLEVHSASDGAPTSGIYLGGNYSSGSVDFGGDAIQRNYWTDNVTIDPTALHPQGSSGTAEITYNLTGSFTELGNGNSSASSWYFITDTHLVRHIDGSDSNVISTYSSFVDTIGFQYGVPFTIQGGLAANAVTSGSQSAHVDASLSLRYTGLSVISGATPIDFTSSSNTGSAGRKSVSHGVSYTGFSLTNTSPLSYQSAINLLGGIATTDTAVEATFLGHVAGFTQASDIVDITGLGSDKYVMQLSYDEATANSLLGGEANAKLLWMNPATGIFEAAADGDSDGGAQTRAFQGSYASDGSPALGDYGVDTANNVVWAVVDHNSEFAVGLSAAPEPTSWAMLACGLGTLSCWRRRHSR